MYYSNISVIGNDLGKNLEIFAELPGGKSTVLGEFNFLCISALNPSNLVSIPGAKFDGHRDTCNRVP